MPSRGLRLPATALALVLIFGTGGCISRAIETVLATAIMSELIQEDVKHWQVCIVSDECYMLGRGMSSLERQQWPSHSQDVARLDDDLREREVARELALIVPLCNAGEGTVQRVVESFERRDCVCVVMQTPTPLGTAPDERAVRLASELLAEAKSQK
jgi:hypothetical protein